MAIRVADMSDGGFTGLTQCGVLLGDFEALLYSRAPGIVSFRIWMTVRLLRSFFNSE